MVVSTGVIKKNHSSSHISGEKGGRKHMLQRRLTQIRSVFKELHTMCFFLSNLILPSVLEPFAGATVECSDFCLETSYLNGRSFPAVQ